MVFAGEDRPGLGAHPVQAAKGFAVLVSGKVVGLLLKCDGYVPLALAPVAGTLLLRRFAMGLTQNAVGNCAVGPGGHLNRCG